MIKLLEENLGAEAIKLVFHITIISIPHKFALTNEIGCRIERLYEKKH